MLAIVLTTLLAQLAVPPGPPTIDVLVPEAEAAELAATTSRLTLELRGAGYDMRPVLRVAPGADLAWEAAARLADADAPWAVVGLHAGATHTTADVWFLLGESGVQGWTSSTARKVDVGGALLALRVAEILHALRQGQMFAVPEPPAAAPPPPPPRTVPAAEPATVWVGVGVTHLRFGQTLGGVWAPEATLAVRAPGSGAGLRLRAFGLGSGAEAATGAGSAKLHSMGVHAAALWTTPRWHGVQAEIAAGPALLRHDVTGSANAGFAARTHTLWRPAAWAAFGVALPLGKRVRVHVDLGARWERSLGLRIGREVAARTGPLAMDGALGVELSL